MLCCIQAIINERKRSLYNCMFKTYKLYKSTGESCLNDLLLPTPDRLYSAQFFKNLSFYNQIFQKEKFPQTDIWLKTWLVER